MYYEVASRLEAGEQQLDHTRLVSENNLIQRTGKIIGKK